MQKFFTNIRGLITSKSSYAMIIIITAFVLIYLITKLLAPTFNIYATLVQFYASLLGHSFELLSGWVGFDTTYTQSLYQLSNAEVTFSILSKLAIKFYFIAFAILFVFPRKLLKTLLAFLLASLALYIVGVLRFFIDFSRAENVIYLYLPIVYSARYLVLYFLIRYKISLHPVINQFIQKIDLKIRPKFQFSLMTLIAILIMLFSVIGFMDWFMIVQSQAVVDFLSKWIMWYAEIILKTLGYDAYVTGYQINIDNYWVYLGTPCLGAGLMALFAILIWIIRSPWINKVIYIVIGLNIIIFANSVRIVAILLHIYENQIPGHLIEDYHNMSNNYFYVLVFLMIIVYVRWFHSIEFMKLKDGNN